MRFHAIIVIYILPFTGVAKFFAQIGLHTWLSNAMEDF